jgi:hypothetical protein
VSYPAYEKHSAYKELKNHIMSTIAIAELKERQIPAGFSMAGLIFVLATITWIGHFRSTPICLLPSITTGLNATAAQVSKL